MQNLHFSFVLFSDCVLFQTMDPSKQFDLDQTLEKYVPNFRVSDQIEDERLSEVIEEVFSTIKLTELECIRLELATRGQASNMYWRKIRTVLITASNFKLVCTRKPTTAPDNLVKMLRGYTEPPPYVKSLVYGRKMESVALRAYGNQHIKQCGPIEISHAGLKINPKYPYLGASIDGLVMCPVCGPIIVEIKCPYGTKDYTWRKMKPLTIAENKKFYSSIVDGKLRLKSSHQYYYQVQAQMGIYQIDNADFVIWTQKDISVERVPFNIEFWKDMTIKLERFYKKAMLKEILTDRIARGKIL